MNAAPRWNRPRAAAAALLVVGALLLHAGTAGWGDLYNETDGQYAAAAKTMAQGGSWIIPENNGIPRLVKPPLLYWFMGAGFTLFGVNEFAARLPNALAFAGWVGVVLLLAIRFVSFPAAVLAAGWTGLCIGAFTLGRIIMPEPWFALFFTASLYCVLRGYAEDRRRFWWYAGFWLCAALACFIKGWHGLLLPLAAILAAAPFCGRQWKNLLPLASPAGVLILLAVNLPWLWYVETVFPGFLRQLAVDEGLGHILGSDAPATGRVDVPPAQFLLLHLAWWFPASAIAITCLLKWLRVGGAGLHHPRFPVALLWSWASLTLIILLLLGQRQDYYAMVMWPAAFIGMAWAWERFPSATALWIPGCLLACGIPAGLFLHAAGQSAGSATAPMAERASAWTTVTNFDIGVWQSLGPVLSIACGAGALFLLLAAWCEYKARRNAVVAATLLSCASLGLGATAGVDIVSPYFSHANIARHIEQLETFDGPVFFDGPIDTGSSLLFYLDRPIYLLGQEPESEFATRRFGIGRERFADPGHVARQIALGPAALITEASNLGDWTDKLGALPLPAASAGTQVLLLLPQAEE